MGKKYGLPLIILLALIGGLIAVSLMHASDLAVLNPRGTIAQQQFNLILFTASLSLVIVIPVFALTFYIVWKYRVGNKASNKKAKYTPDWDGNRVLEGIWWLVPLLLISILAVVTWKTSHSLDPYKALSSDKKPVTVQVIALQWKWLFIYPEQHIASVNYVQFPKDTPVNFEITADAPMNSFWIPQLGGQVYAMSGMATQLHLQASQVGEYKGSSANLSGEGFSGMTFIAKATTQSHFDSWVKAMQEVPEKLDHATYDKLAAPSKDMPPTYYSSADPQLYDTVIMKYMTPGSDHHETAPTEGTQ
jgi:cytochrome o ubiquinol oxidase subunit 2